MDHITRCYRAQMRLVRGSDELFWVRWYPASPDAEWYEEGTPFRSSQDRDINTPDPSLGEVRAKCPRWVSCCFCPPPPKVCERGDEDTFANGVRPEDLAVASPSAQPCGSACARLAELIDRDPISAQYGWWQLVCDPATGLWSRGPALTHRHRLQDDPAWDQSGMPGLAVPGTIVQVFEGCGPDRPWWFVSGDHGALVLIGEDSPTIELASGVAYHATLAVPGLTGQAGDQEVTGAWDTGPAIAVIDLAHCPSIDRSTPYVARRVGLVDDLVVYATRLTGCCASGSGSGGGIPGCGPQGVPTPLFATFGGTLAAFGTITLNYTSGCTWFGTTFACGGVELPVFLEYDQFTQDWEISGISTMGVGTGPASYGPFLLNLSWGSLGLCTSAGTATVVVTE